MTRHLAVWIAGVIVALTVAGSAAVAPAAPLRPTQASAPVDSPALARLASCVTGRKDLAVVLLVDESGSLKETDPDGGRVAAARAALLGLESLVERSDGEVAVDLLVAGFGVDFEGDAKWIGLGPETVGTADLRVESFAERNSALDTDYVYGLQKALTAVRSRAQEMSADGTDPACTAVLWFTDGRFDVEDRTNAARRDRGRDSNGESQFKDYAPDVDLYRAGGGERAVEQGKQVLCERGGLADQFRSSETSLFTVALTTSIDGSDQDFLQAVTVGGFCGELDGTKNGMLFAGDLGRLVGSFDQIVTALANPASSEEADLTTCPLEQQACPQGTKTFEVDGSLQRFHVLAQTDAPGVAVRFTAPGADPLDIPVAGSTDQAGAGVTGDSPVTWAWLSANALTIDAESSPSGTNWAGTWTVTFTDTTGTNPGAPVRAQIYLFGDVVPQLVDGTEFRAGDTTPFDVELVRSEGTPIPPTSLSGEVRVTASVTDPATGETVDIGELEPAADGSWSGEYRAPEKITSSTVNLALQTDVLTESGVALAPAVSTVPVVVLPPVGFPSVATTSMGVGPIVGTDPVRASIKVNGSDKADTCVWLDRLQLDPGAVDRAGLSVEAVGPGSSEQDCLQIPEGEDADLQLQFTADEPQRALATGSVVLGTRSANANEVRLVEVDLDAQLVKPASVGVAWILFALMLLVGVGVPVLLFYLANYMVAKFAPLRLMAGCAVRMAITETSVERLDPPSGDRLVHQDDFHPVGGGSEQPRSFSFAGVDFEARTSRNPLRPPDGHATKPGRAVVGSARHAGSNREDGRIPLWVTREWVFVPDEAAAEDEDGPVAGTLIAFLPATDHLASSEAIDNALRELLPAIAEHCRRVRPIRAMEPIAATVGDAVGSHSPGSLWDTTSAEYDHSGTGLSAPDPVGGPSPWQDDPSSASGDVEESESPRAPNLRDPGNSPEDLWDD